MMKIYVAYEEDDWRTAKYGYIDGNHGEGGLPGVTCHACGSRWAAYGLSYPTVDVSSIPNYKSLLKARNVTVSQFEEVRQKILHLLPPGSYLPPGTAFGPVSGEVIGTLATFAWIEGGMLINADVYKEMMAEGLEMPDAVHANLTFGKGNPPINMLELSMPPVARLSPSCYADQAAELCEVCGRLGIVRPEEMIVQMSSIPPNVEMFRTQESGAVFVLDAFRDYCISKDLKNIAFREQVVATDE
jgi:uncharacterized double-CXXCG motif protein